MERIQEIVRLRDLLGLSLEQLSKLLEAETARAELRRELQVTEDPVERRADTRGGARPHRDPTRARPWPRSELEKLEHELADKRQNVRSESWRELGRLTARAGVGSRPPRDGGAVRGHLCTDIAQGCVPALLPFLILRDHMSLAAAAALVLAATISSSVIQPLFGTPLGPAVAAVADAARARPGRPRDRAGRIRAELRTLFASILLSGIGVAAFHPEGSRFANYVSGARGDRVE